MKTMKVLFEVGFRAAGMDAGTIDKIIHAHRSGDVFELFGEKFRPHSISYSGPENNHYTVEMYHLENQDDSAVSGPVNTTEPGSRIPIAFSDPEMQRAYDAGEQLKTPDEKRIEHLESLLASASRYVEDCAENSSIARRLYKKIVDAFDGDVPQADEYDERIASLEEFDVGQSYTEVESFTADYMLQKDWAVLNDDATVYGCTLRHVRTLIEDYTPHILKKNMRGLVVMPPRMIKALEAAQLTGRFGYYGRVPEGAATEFYNAALADVEELNDSTGKGHESFTLPQIVALLRGDK